MKCSLENKLKKELFVSLFYNLKNCSTLISLVFKKEGLFIQGMDKSHVCMYEVNINKDWFHTYENDEIESIISLDSQTFFSVLNLVNDFYKMEIYQNDSLKDNLNIDLLVQNEKSGEFSKYFIIPLAEIDFELFTLPNIEYEVDFSMDAKKICEITSQMITFGADLRINCSDEKVNLSTEGELGDMLVTIPIDDLNEYSIAEDETIDLLYSLTFVHKMCLTTKLSSDVNISISKDYPMKISYDLGAGSQLLFYLAPKIQ
jgi:proliferating cell nuclear antigen PCNA